MTSAIIPLPNHNFLLMILLYFLLYIHYFQQNSDFEKIFKWIYQWKMSFNPVLSRLRKLYFQEKLLKHFILQSFLIIPSSSMLNT